MFGIVLICVLIGDLCLVVMDDDEDVVCIEAPIPSNACTPRPGLLGMAGPSESVLMVKVRSPHLSPFAQENSRSSEGLTVSMCGQKNGRSSTVMRPAAALNLTLKTLILIFTRKLAN